MIGICAVAAGTLLLTGGGIGFLMVIALGIHREEATLSMTNRTTDRLSNGVRAVNGVTSRSTGVLQEVSLYRQGLLTIDGHESEA
jgi:hypothetical protein